MKLFLVDCTRASSGGSLQHISSFIDQARKNNQTHIFDIVISNNIKKRVISDIGGINDLNIIWVSNNFLLSSLYLSIIQFRYKSIFILVGPPLWIPLRNSITCFAVPHYLYNFSEFCSVYEHAKHPIFKLLYVRTNILLRKLIHFIFLIPNNKILVQTEVVKKRLGQNLQFVKDKIFVLPNSLPSLVLNNKIKKFPLKEKSFLRILIPSSYYPHKNFDSISFLSRYKFPFKLKIFFTLRRNQLPKNYNLFKLKNVEIIFTGQLNLDELSNAYLNTDIVLLPSILECFSSVYQEASFFERPFITPDTDFAREVLGDTAYFYDHNQKSSLYDSILKVKKDFENNEVKLPKVRKKYNISPEEKYNLQLSYLLN